MLQSAPRPVLIARIQCGIGSNEVFRLGAHSRADCGRAAFGDSRPGQRPLGLRNLWRAVHHLRRIRRKVRFLGVTPAISMICELCGDTRRSPSVFRRVLWLPLSQPQSATAEVQPRRAP